MARLGYLSWSFVNSRRIRSSLVLGFRSGSANILIIPKWYKASVWAVGSLRKYTKIDGKCQLIAQNQYLVFTH